MNHAGLDGEEYRELYEQELRWNNPSFFDEDGKATSEHIDWLVRKWDVSQEYKKKREALYDPCPYCERKGGHRWDCRDHYLYGWQNLD